MSNKSTELAKLDKYMPILKAENKIEIIDSNRAKELIREFEKEYGTLPLDSDLEPVYDNIMQIVIDPATEHNEDLKSTIRTYILRRSMLYAKSRFEKFSKFIQEYYEPEKHTWDESYNKILKKIEEKTTDGFVTLDYNTEQDIAIEVGYILNYIYHKKQKIKEIFEDRYNLNDNQIIKELEDRKEKTDVEYLFYYHMIFCQDNKLLIPIDEKEKTKNQIERIKNANIGNIITNSGNIYDPEGEECEEESTHQEEESKPEKKNNNKNDVIHTDFEKYSPIFYAECEFKPLNLKEAKDLINQFEEEYDSLYIESEEQTNNLLDKIKEYEKDKFIDFFRIRQSMIAAKSRIDKFEEQKTESMSNLRKCERKYQELLLEQKNEEKGTLYLNKENKDEYNENLIELRKLTNSARGIENIVRNRYILDEEDNNLIQELRDMDEKIKLESFFYNILILSQDNDWMIPLEEKEEARKQIKRIEKKNIEMKKKRLKPQPHQNQ